MTDHGNAFRVVVLTCDDAGIETGRVLHALDGIEVAAVVRAPHRRGTLKSRIRRVYRARGIGGFFAIALNKARRLAPSRPAAAEEEPPFPVVRFADFHGQDCIDALHALGADLGVVDGTYILRDPVFTAPRLGSLNIHCGKVPEYRGAPPAFWELYNGERQAGVTIHRVNAKVDQGPVLAQEVFPLDPAPAGDPAAYAREYWAGVLRPNALRMLAGAVSAIAAGTAVERAQDPGEGATYRMPRLEDVRELRRRVKARRGNGA
jgi:methionyl-tRNA formyltransferase